MNKRQKKRRLGIKKRLSSISKPALLILNIGLPLILFYLSAFLVSALSIPDIPGYVLARIHYHTLEHIIMSATLIISGAVFVDLAAPK